ncbi:PucR family transcriptional regulator ligand-binding domain-containing protein [Lentilactobacillus buchneri]|uniref:Sugar diacid utilization regulator n=1 Tax=Lentilactobacillus buchneri subsp. silagei CD034 TaxID=1071400 RepID=J9W4Z3_LENBU|nr:PucR family transcriptional regulator ligand-binding domain-containing protein [Lentilactobacillus buchneri]AFR99340.1 sugar diacid utilization regulator [Lentilactobacillus buchneri subsp. silagei CD034]
MIDLQKIANKEQKYIVQVNQVPLANRKVNAITIMDSGTADGWAQAGQIVITSSRMMPEKIETAKTLIHQLVEKQASCLMIKPYADNEESDIPQTLIDYCTHLDFPLFQIRENTTYIQIMNDINAILFEGRRINKMADLDLDYLLKTNSASDKDFDFISSLKNVDLYSLKVRVARISLSEIPKPSERIAVQFNLMNQIRAFFDRVQQEKRIKTYFIVESADGATAISFFDHEQMELPPDDRIPFKRLISNVRIPRFTVYEGVSNAHPAKKFIAPILRPASASTSLRPWTGHDDPSFTGTSACGTW